MSRQGWNPARAAVVICDMWDAHHCVAAAERVEELAPPIDAAASALRARGALIIHAPGDCAGFYRGTPARVRALHAPAAEAPVAFDWNRGIPGVKRRCRPLADPGPCSCDSAEPCCPAGPPYPWTRVSMRRQLDTRAARTCACRIDRALSG